MCVSFVGLAMDFTKTQKVIIGCVHLLLVNFWSKANTRWPPQPDLRKHNNGYNPAEFTEIELKFGALVDEHHH